MIIRFTKEVLQLGKVFHQLEYRHRLLLCRIIEATVEDQPHRELLFAVELVEKEIRESGYEGPYLDVAEYAKARF